MERLNAFEVGALYKEPQDASTPLFDKRSVTVYRQFEEVIVSKLQPWPPRSQHPRDPPLILISKLALSVCHLRITFRFPAHVLISMMMMKSPLTIPKCTYTITSFGVDYAAEDFGYRASYTTSLASNITDYKYENGRRYHAYKEGSMF